MTTFYSALGHTDGLLLGAGEIDGEVLRRVDDILLGVKDGVTDDTVLGILDGILPGIEDGVTDFTVTWNNGGIS